MSGPGTGTQSMIMDACVFIDFIKADRYVLELIAKHIGPVHVVSPTVEEIKEIEDETELIELGVVVIEPEVQDGFLAAVASKAISFQDHLCLLTAQRHGFVCVTNDKRLRTECEAENIPCFWGLELLSLLHKSGGIRANDAIEIARQIQSDNHRHISLKLLQDFVNIIRSNRP